MPSEKAKENKTLAANCAACGKAFSVELIQGMIVRIGHRRTTVPVCDGCRAKGWQPPAATESSPPLS